MTRVIGALAVLLLFGCASTPLVNDDGYQNPTFPYRLAWRDKAKRQLLSPEWRVRNITRAGDGADPTLKTGPEWEVTYSLRREPDAESEAVMMPSVDLAFTKAGSSKSPMDGVVTIRSVPLEPRPSGGDDDRTGLATSELARLADMGALTPWLWPGERREGDARAITATVQSSRVRKVAGRPAVQLELTLQEARPDATVVRHATSVFVFTGYRHDPDGPVDRTRRRRAELYPVLLSVTWVGAPDSVPGSWQTELDELLGRIRFGVQEIGEPPKARAGTVNPMGGDSDGFDWP